LKEIERELGSKAYGRRQQRGRPEVAEAGRNSKRQPWPRAVATGQQAKSRPRRPTMAGTMTQQGSEGPARRATAGDWFQQQQRAEEKKEEEEGGGKKKKRKEKKRKEKEERKKRKEKARKIRGNF